MTSRISIPDILPNPSRRVSVAVRLIAPAVVGLVLLVVSLSLSTSGAAGASGVNETVIEDGFTGSFLTMEGRSPDTVATSSWSVASGSWFVTDLSPFRATNVNPAMADYRVTIDSGISNGTVEAELFWSSGDKAGVVARYADESNWLMAWYDGTTLTLEQNVSGATSTLGSSSPSWSSGTSKTVSFGLNGT